MFVGLFAFRRRAKVDGAKAPLRERLYLRFRIRMELLTRCVTSHRLQRQCVKSSL